MKTSQDRSRIITELEASRTKDKLWMKPWFVALVFLLLVVLLHLSSFFQPVIEVNWDEGLYLLVAEKWLNGSPPYTAIWDNKPLGIYLIFASVLKIFGHSIISIRIAACIAVTITCYLLYLLGKSIGRNGTIIGLISGILYIVNTLNSSGLVSNTELFYSPFTTLAFYLFFSSKFDFNAYRRRDTSRLIAIGLALGTGFEIKYTVIFDLVALLLAMGIIISVQFKSDKKFSIIARYSLFIVVGFVIPFLIVSSYYWVIGEFNQYIYANFTANKTRVIKGNFSLDLPLGMLIDQVRHNPISWICATTTPIYLLFAKNASSREKRTVLGLFIWFSVPAIAICLVFTRAIYTYYFLQLAPPLSLLTAYMLTRLSFTVGKRRSFVLAAILSVLIFSQAFKHLELGAKYVYFRQIKGNQSWLEDTSTAVANYLKPRIDKDDYIYVVDDQPVIYFLTGAKIPTNYAYPPFLVQRVDFANIAGIDPLEELDSIFQKHPLYIIKRKNENDKFYAESAKLFFKKLDKQLDKDYALEQTISRLGSAFDIDLYRRKSES